VRHGLSAETPAAIVQQGTTPRQRVVCGSLADLPELAQREKLQAPTLIIIGGVVSLRDKLAWFHPESIQK
jgi:uroporphyrin-III C-methyltransferase / precorrin-2 dehydrogenase / sirohydrochlorin ferrochelatase